MGGYIPNLFVFLKLQIVLCGVLCYTNVCYVISRKITNSILHVIKKQGQATSSETLPKSKQTWN